MSDPLAASILELRIAARNVCSEDTPTERRVVDFRDHLATLRIATQHQRNGCPGTGFGPQALNGGTNARYAKRPPDPGPGAVPMRRVLTPPTRHRCVADHDPGHLGPPSTPSTGSLVRPMTEHSIRLHEIEKGRTCPLFWAGCAGCDWTSPISSDEGAVIDEHQAHRKAMT